jgi:hypothetical protein
MIFVASVPHIVDLHPKRGKRMASWTTFFGNQCKSSAMFFERNTHSKQVRKGVTWLGIRNSCAAIAGNRSLFPLKIRGSSMNEDIRRLSAANSVVRPRNKNSLAGDTSAVNHGVQP